MIKIRPTLALSSTNRKYINAEISFRYLMPYIEKMQDILGDDFEEFSENRIGRSGKSFHLTIIGPNEYTMEHNELVNLEYEIELVGLGTASKSNDQCFFVVVESKGINKIRESTELDKKDLHITLGFKGKDIHGIPKGKNELVGI